MWLHVWLGLLAAAILTSRSCVWRVDATDETRSLHWCQWARVYRSVQQFSDFSSWILARDVYCIWAVDSKSSAMPWSSGAERIWKCGGTGLERKLGARIRREAPEIFFLVVPLHFFGSKSTISRFGERFRVGQYTVWSVSHLLFFYSRCPPCPAICKSVGHAPRALWSWRHWPQSTLGDALAY